MGERAAYMKKVTDATDAELKDVADGRDRLAEERGKLLAKNRALIKERPSQGVEIQQLRTSHENLERRCILYSQDELAGKMAHFALEAEKATWTGGVKC